MIRILLLLVPVFLVYLAIRWFQKTSADEIGRKIKKIGWIIAIVLLFALAASGKLNVLFAMLGVIIAFIVRLMPVILRYAPQLQRLWQAFNTGKSQSNRQQSYRPPRGSSMSKAEALEVLGLKVGASEKDIIDAHRKLISKVHPDRGGSDYLAAQINLAKKILLSA